MGDPPVLRKQDVPGLEPHRGLLRQPAGFAEKRIREMAAKPLEKSGGVQNPAYGFHGTGAGRGMPLGLRLFQEVCW